MSFSAGNNVRLLQDGEATYRAMFLAIGAATDHINLESYKIEDDAVGRKLADMLLSKRAQGVQDQAQAENALTAAIGRLFAVAEAYPELRATENFQQLQAQLSEVEGQIAVSRQVYNDTVLSYENALETVPTSVIAGIFNFRAREYFEVEEAAAREAPQVSFS